MGPKAKPTVVNKKVDETKVEDEKEEEKEEREAAEAQAEAEEAKAAQIATLKIEIEEIEKELERLKPAITEIYTKSKELELKNTNTNTNTNKNKNKTDLTIEELSPEEFEAFKNYVNVYKTLIEKKDELYTAENTNTEEWSLIGFLLAPVKKFFGSLLDNAKKMGVKGTMATVTGVTGFTVECYEQIQPNLIKFAQLKGETQRAINEASQIPGAAVPTTDVPTTDVPTDGLPTVPGVPTTDGLPTTGLPTIPTVPGLPTVVGGGRNNNLKEIQKGGAAAAKRVENSIKQFLGSSITSSHILNMVKRTTRIKRNRKSKGTRQSRRRARRQ